MAFPLFKSWWPTAAASWHIASWHPRWKVIYNNRTGSPIGIQSQNANGFDGIWAPTPVTAAQIASPDTNMLQDLNATFQLDAAPYSRYRSDGTQLVPLDAESGMIIPPGFNEIVFSPLVVTEGNPLLVEGGIRVIQ